MPGCSNGIVDVLIFFFAGAGLGEGLWSLFFFSIGPGLSRMLIMLLGKGVVARGGSLKFCGVGMTESLPGDSFEGIEVLIARVCVPGEDVLILG